MNAKGRGKDEGNFDCSACCGLRQQEYYSIMK